MADNPRGRKPRPPASLTDAEAQIWTNVCRTQDANWCELAASGSLLERYCIARAYFDLLVAHRRKMMATPVDPEEHEPPTLESTFRLSEEIIKQSAEVLRLERSLRLTPQSRQEPKGTRNQPPAPWESAFPEDDGDTA